MTAKTRAKPSLHRDSFVAPLARGTRTLPGAVVGLRLLKHTAGPLANIAQKIPTLGFSSLLFNTIIVTRKVFAIHELRYQPAKVQA